MLNLEHPFSFTIFLNEEVQKTIFFLKTQLITCNTCVTFIDGELFTEQFLFAIKVLEAKKGEERSKAIKEAKEFSQQTQELRDQGIVDEFGNFRKLPFAIPKVKDCKEEIIANDLEIMLKIKEILLDPTKKFSPEESYKAASSKWSESLFNLKKVHEEYSNALSTFTKNFENILYVVPKTEIEKISNIVSIGLCNGCSAETIKKILSKRHIEISDLIENEEKPFKSLLLAL